MRVTAALALMLLLSGCVPTPPAETPVASPSPTPVFASEEEALAAAEEAYAAYLAALDSALATHDDSQLASVAQGEALAAALDSVENFRRQGRHQTGLASTRLVEIAQPGGLLSGESNEPLQAYGCLDISSVHVFDASGGQVDPPDRRNIFPMLITLAWSSGSILVEDVEVWEGSDFCV